MEGTGDSVGPTSSDSWNIRFPSTLVNDVSSEGSVRLWKVTRGGGVCGAVDDGDEGGFGGADLGGRGADDAASSGWHSNFGERLLSLLHGLRTDRTDQMMGPCLSHRPMS